MIGRYLDVLTAAQEDRVLTGKMVPGQYVRDDGARCLVGNAADMDNWCETRDSSAYRAAQNVGLTYWNAVRRRKGLRYCEELPGDTLTVAGTYDALCDRCGIERANALIRNRILRNRARRALQGVRMDAADPLCMELSR